MSAAFYASPLIGATTTIGVFFHEIPHEVGDFALLVQSGFTKWQAMGAQFVTAIGAFIGTLIGIAIQHFSAGGDGAGSTAAVPWNGGIWSTGLAAGDLVLPFTAGTFLYVGFSAVPEVLQVDEARSRTQEITRSLCQLLAMAAGFAIMVLSVFLPSLPHPHSPYQKRKKKNEFLNNTLSILLIFFFFPLIYCSGEIGDFFEYTVSHKIYLYIQTNKTQDTRHNSNYIQSSF